GDPSACGQVFDNMEHAAPATNGYFTFDGQGASGSVTANTFDLLPGIGGSASLAVGWNETGTTTGGFLGGFGRTQPSYPNTATHFDFWIKPDPGRDFFLEVNLQDDDNNDGAIPSVPDGADDEFQHVIRIAPSGGDVTSGGGWQLVSIPLDEFTDDNSFHTGGNGVLDLVPAGAGGNGELINVVFAMVNQGTFGANFRTDNWAFTRRTSSIGGRVWNDIGADGVDLGEPGLAGVTLNLVDSASGLVVQTFTTSASGAYTFAELSDGDYEIRVNASTLPAGASATFDPDGIATPGTLMITLACDEVRLGQSFGYDASGPSGIGTPYCGPAVNNSLGLPGELRASGSIAAAANDVRLLASQLPPGSLGYFIVGASAGFIPNPGGSSGNLCILPPLGRYVPFAAAVSPAGTMELDLDLTAIPQPTSTVAAHPGETWRFQLWHRDGIGGVPTSNFTEGLAITFE
ncbi:MAG: SdrD B-like domain-containing protein, partial [Planctomycetota bacterium]